MSKSSKTLPETSLKRVSELRDLALDFFTELGIVSDKLLGGFTSLSKFLVAVAEPLAALSDNAVFDTEVHDFAGM